MIARDWGDVFIVAAMLVSSGMLGLSIGRHGWRGRKWPSNADRLLADYDEPVEHKARYTTRPPKTPLRHGVVYLEFSGQNVISGVTSHFRGWYGVTVLGELEGLYQIRYEDAQLQASLGMSKWVDKGRVRLARPLSVPHETQAADALLR